MTIATPSLTRLKVRSEYLFVRHGVSERRKTVVIQARQRGRDEIGCGFTATKKIGNAVIRNRAKRRLRAAASEHLPRLGRKGVDYVFIARASTAAADWQRLLDDVESALISLAAHFEPTQ